MCEGVIEAIEGAEGGTLTVRPEPFVKLRTGLSKGHSPITLSPSDPFGLSLSKPKKKHNKNNIMSTDIIQLDGSTGEGGGQILRSALSLSACTGQPFEIINIRAKRPKPGLMRQHLACVQAAQRICHAQVQGADLGSQSLRFEPGPVTAGTFEFSIAGAGSCMLVLQTVLPPLMLADAPSRVVLRGGTHNPMAPPFTMIERSFAPLLHRMGVGLGLDLRRCGFFPAGGGEVWADIAPTQDLQVFDLLERGTLQQAWAECLAPALPGHVAERELATVQTSLGWSAAQIRKSPQRANEGPGNALVLTLQYQHVTEVVTSFGEKTVSAEQVAKKAVGQVRRYQKSEAPVGEHLADQLMLPMALAVVAQQRKLVRAGAPAGAQTETGTVRARYACTEVSEHSRTNLAVIERFLPVSGRIEQDGDRRWVVELSTDLASS